MQQTPLKVGDRVSFYVQRVFREHGTNSYEHKKYSGRIEKIEKPDMRTSYTVKVKNEKDYFKIYDNQIVHIWYTV